MEAGVRLKRTKREARGLLGTAVGRIRVEATPHGGSVSDVLTLLKQRSALYAPDLQVRGGDGHQASVRREAGHSQGFLQFGVWFWLSGLSHHHRRPGSPHRALLPKSNCGNRYDTRCLPLSIPAVVCCPGRAGLGDPGREARRGRPGCLYEGTFCPFLGPPPPGKAARAGGAPCPPRPPHPSLRTARSALGPKAQGRGSRTERGSASPLPQHLHCPGKKGCPGGTAGDAQARHQTQRAGGCARRFSGRAG